ncbi:MAG TPA: MAPEG family protein [Polyangiaceae bacterium]|nr:MAPEG family protein [Polyangiaceae bacterium]
MTLPLYTLVGFAAWTLLLLACTVGVHRWRLILTKRAAVNAFPADAPDGPGWYQRATRAHLNCIENLPPYAAIVLTLTLAGRHGALIDALAIAVSCARVFQTLIHVLFVQTERAVVFRFSFYTVQLLAMLWMVVLVFA